MCGIAGIAARGPVDRRVLDRAVAALRHRGPDSDGIFIDPDARVGLCHTRLSIIDLSSAGNQPMTSDDGRVTITFNGEIYNFHELRGELAARGYHFKGQSDTEVLLAGYVEFGAAVLEKLNGIFAFGIYDGRSRELFLARDQLGVKPLYYTQTSGGVAFASEIKALLGLLPVDGEIDLSAIRRYLAFLWCPGEQTPLKNVKKLLPGSALIVRDGVVKRSWSYWQPPRYTPRRDRTEQDCAVELNDLIGRCVDRQMVSDAPLGAFLSGGVDSSTIVAKARDRNPNIECFTIHIEGGAESGTTDDLPYARAVAAHLGVKLFEVTVDSKRMCDRVVDMTRMLDEPLADPACLNVLFISELARSHGIKVLLSGVGGDDLFTGYRRHTVLGLDRLFGSVPGGIWDGLSRVTSQLDQRSGTLRRLAQVLRLAAAQGNRRIIDSFIWGEPRSIDPLLSGDVRSALANEDVAQPLEDVIADASSLSAVEKCLMLERRFFLTDLNLLYTDKMAMAAGIEARVPLLDLDLVKFAAEIPTEWKQGFWQQKKILLASQRGILPDSVLDRPKTGFGAPLRRWIKHEMNDLIHELLSPSVIEQRGLFDPAAVQAMLVADRAGRIDGSYTLFSMMCIELWCRDFLDGRPLH